MLSEYETSRAKVRTDELELMEAGWNPRVAEALAENGFDAASAANLSADEAFEYFCNWTGFLGYATIIRNALDNCRNMEAFDA